MILSLSLISSAYIKDTAIDLKISTNSSPCNVTITYPNTTNFIYNKPMTMGTGYANYTLNITELGNYGYYSDCGNGIIEVTPNGESNASGIFLVFIYFLFIISIIGLIVTFILTLVNLATSRETIFGVLTAWGFFALVLIADYLTKNYLNDTFLSSFTDLFISITAWSNVLLPLIALFITFFVKGTQKKKPLGINELTGGRYG